MDMDNCVCLLEKTTKKYQDDGSECATRQSVYLIPDVLKFYESNFDSCDCDFVLGEFVFVDGAVGHGNQSDKNGKIDFGVPRHEVCSLFLKNINDYGEWVEWSGEKYNQTNVTYRLSAVRELPEIDLEATFKRANLTFYQKENLYYKHRPIIPDGTLFKGSILHRSIGGMLSEMFTERAKVANVEVVSTWQDAEFDCPCITITLRAKTREDIETALANLDCTNPKEAKTDYILGSGDETREFCATVTYRGMID